MLQGGQPVVVDQFGGLVTSIDPGDLPNGLASEATDCEFYTGGFSTRGAFESYLAPSKLAAVPVTSILSFPRNDGTRQRLILQANGTLSVEYPEATVTTIETLLGNNQIMRGCCLNDRAFMAFSDGKTPGTRPRWYNSKGWFDPVGQEGPSSCVNTGTSVAASGNATASALGYRQVLTTFETRGGYVTLPSSSIISTVAIAANDQYVFKDMPIPPSNVTKLRIGLTANSGSDFYLSPILIQAPPAGAGVTNAWSPPYDTGRPNFSDTDLAQAGVTPHERLVNWPLPPCMGVEAYNARLIAWGALNYVPKVLITNQGTAALPLHTLNYTAGLKNGSFTGGTIMDPSVGSQPGDPPTGWATTVAPANGGLVVQIPGGAGTSWKIVGDGAHAVRGELTSSTKILRLNDFPPGTIYRVRMRVKKSTNAGTYGTLNFEIKNSGTSIQIPFASITTDWAWYDYVLLTASDNTVDYAHLWADKVTIAGADHYVINNEWVAVDDIQIYPDTAPTLNGYLLISQPNDLETFDYTRGILGVRPGDGQAIVNCAELRGTLYAFKERSIFGVNDNGNDPYKWDPPSLMSDVVGCLSVHGVGRGDGWLVTISESGAYVFAGGQPQKISQEIYPTWNTINWPYKHLSWCVVDPDAQRIYIGVPTGSASYVNTLLVCDYVAGLTTDPTTSPGSGRKWSVWTPPGTPGLACGARIDRDNGQRTFVVGGGIASTEGYISARIASRLAGTTATYDTFGSSTPDIASRYTTATVGQPMERSFFNYVLAKVRGGGHVRLDLIRPDTTIFQQAQRPLTGNELHDMEWQTRDTDTAVGLSFSAAAGDWFSIKRAAAYNKKAPFGHVRGY